ncbi:MAG TPA: hypothetical protein VMA95_01705 [Streptosporangiaceae bacterium]|nr:hypothetical protein [Streptosporangiaceae bacterium]
MATAHIEIKVIRDQQAAFQFGENDQLSTGPEPIAGFIVSDNGEGFHDENMRSFETLDSEYKSAQGCRGVGRLLWLIAFDKVEVFSHYLDSQATMKRREFTFTKDNGVSPRQDKDATVGETGSEVQLLSFKEVWRQRAPKHLSPIARGILEHCLWYFVRPGGAPHISIFDETEHIDLDTVFDEYMLAGSTRQQLTVKDRPFDLVHVRLRVSGRTSPQLNWCAGNRVVFPEKLAGKVPGLYGKLKDDEADFIYACYITSPFLDDNVRSERTAFDIPEANEGTFDEAEPSMSDIREATLKAAEQYLLSSLTGVREAGRARVERFVNTKSPRYRPILRHIDQAKLSVDPAISDEALELVLHRHFTEFETELLAEGQRVLEAESTENQEYEERLQEYLAKVEDAKKSDLAAYVSRRRVNLDLLAKAIESDRRGSYSLENVIHNLIIPMRKTSDDLSESVSNLWIIDERLAFHNYLASDKTIKSTLITDSVSTLEPDILALKLHDDPDDGPGKDGPILVSDTQRPPLASLVVVEIKRPMRNDVRPVPDKDPLHQVLRYLEQVRCGGVKTAAGRPIPESDDIPGFCYVIADLTPTMTESCKQRNLKLTDDHLGYFGYNENYRAYIEVISFDRLLNMAHQRNRAFFDCLGLPVG